MTDELDRAEEEIEHELAEALRQRRPPGPAPTGYCHWCGEAVPEQHRWCDRSCEASWEYEFDRRAVNGNGRTW